MSRTSIDYGTDWSDEEMELSEAQTMKKCEDIVENTTSYKEEATESNDVIGLKIPKNISPVNEVELFCRVHFASDASKVKRQVGINALFLTARHKG
jgi:hypothetical protein